MEAEAIISEKELFEEYILKDKSILKTANMYNCSISSIFRYLKKYKIKIKPIIRTNTYCRECGKVLSGSKYYRCKKCFLLSIKKEKSVCLDCSKTLSSLKSKRCQKCSNILVGKNRKKKVLLYRL